MDQEKIIERIMKLLALSSSSNEYEAAAAAAKAQELLLKYNLTTANLHGEGRRDSDQIIRVHVVAPHPMWLQVLLNGIVNANLCRVCRTHLNGLAVMAVVGEPHNIEVVEYLFSYLAGEISRLAAKVVGSRKYKISWRLGAASTVSRRLREGMEQFRAASPENRALIVVKDNKVTEMYREYFPRIHNKKATFSNDSGFYQGQSDANGIAIRQGIRNQAGQALLRES
ncbi:DUF2786 domain-containing protein [Candidatus Pacearchaeota archaeon]|nr:DUF2786 domain-containing protein [Candidatus Pacearchaeota archaeon]